VRMVHARAVGDVRERSVTVVVIQHRYRARVVGGIAGVMDAALAADSVLGRAPIQIVTDEQVEATVAVVIEPGGACPPRRLRDPGPAGDLGKMAVVVLEQVRTSVA